MQLEAARAQHGLGRVSEAEAEAEAEEADRDPNVRTLQVVLRDLEFFVKAFKGE